MWTLIEEGGYPIWFVLALGALSLLAAVRFALRPARENLAVCLALGVATLIASCGSACADLAKVGHAAREYATAHPELPLWALLLQGLAESLSPLILGLAMLSIDGVLIAAGLFRREARGEI